MDLWLHALTSVDLHLVYASQYTLDTFRDALLENNVLDLQMSYVNLTGSVPDAIAELIADNPDMRRVDLANYIAHVRYNYQKIKSQPVHCYQVSSLASGMIDSDSVPVEHRRKTYIQTRRKLLEQGLDPGRASAFAFTIHNQTPTSHEGSSEVVIGDLRELDLPNAYMAVDVSGNLLIIDSTKGTYPIETSPRLPTQWICRVSPDLNEFLVGDETRCVHVHLTDDCDACIQTPVVLPFYPSEVVCVDSKWVVWGTRERPFAFTWDAGRAVPTIDARKYVVSVGEQVRSVGNQVLFRGESIAKLPATQSISCMYGDTAAIDVVTASLDMYRIDVRSNVASCVGLPVQHPIAVMAPLVGWV